MSAPLDLPTVLYNDGIVAEADPVGGFRMVTPARMHPDGFACAKDNAPFTSVPHETAERPGPDPGAGGVWTASAGGPADRPEVAGPAGPAGPASADHDPRTSLPIRSAERRRWAADLTGPALAGLVLHGAAGIGKSALARQIVSRVSHLEPERVVAVICGEASVDAVLSGVAAALRHHPAVAQGSGQAHSVRAADRADLPWAHRLALLRELVLDQMPVLLVLDDFDDNMSPVSGGWAIRDHALAELIASWGGKSHRGRLLITCRHPFRPPRSSGLPFTFTMSARCAVMALLSWRNHCLPSDHSANRNWTRPGGCWAVIPRPWNTWTRCSPRVTSGSRRWPAVSRSWSRARAAIPPGPRRLPHLPNWPPLPRNRSAWPAVTCCSASSAAPP